MPNKFFDRNWWKDFVVAILATTVSIVLTFGTSKLVDLNKQKKERRLTALMVMSSIESFARSIDESSLFKMPSMRCSKLLSYTTTRLLRPYSAAT